MKKLLMTVVTLTAISSFASKEEYCANAKLANMQEGNRLMSEAVIEQDTQKIDAFMADMDKVEEINDLVIAYCEKK